MIYLNCDKCGLSFRKGHYKRPRCLRCGNPDLWAEEVDPANLELSDIVADKMLRERVKQEKASR